MSYDGSADDDSPVHGSAVSFDVRDFLHIKVWLHFPPINTFKKHSYLGVLLICKQYVFLGEVRQQLVDWQACERKLRRRFHTVTGETGGLEVTSECCAWCKGTLFGAWRIFRQPRREWYALTWFHTTYARYPSTSFFLFPKIHGVLNSMYLIGTLSACFVDP